MFRHVLVLRYNGRRAAYGALAPSASKQVVTGAQMLLGALAHYYVDGRVPEKINDSARGFFIEDLSRIDGCRAAEFEIYVTANSMWDSDRVSFSQLVEATYRAWKRGEPLERLPIARRQAVLAVSENLNEAVFAEEGPDREQRRKLYDRISDAMWFITAPLGSSASVLEIFLDDKLIDQHTERQRTDELIVDALIAMGVRSKPISPKFQ